MVIVAPRSLATSKAVDVGSAVEGGISLTFARSAVIGILFITRQGDLVSCNSYYRARVQVGNYPELVPSVRKWSVVFKYGSEQ